MEAPIRIRFAVEQRLNLRAGEASLRPAPLHIGGMSHEAKKGQVARRT